MTEEERTELVALLRLFELSDLVTIQVKGEKVGLGRDIVKDIVDLARKGMDYEMRAH